MKIKLILPIATLIIFTTIVFIFFTSSQELNEAPNISLSIIDGRKIEINSLKGNPLLITFWSTTCSTCIKEMPHLVELYNQLNKDGLEIIGIAMFYDSPNRVLELTRKRALPYPIGNVEVTPTSFLIDSYGNIIQQKTGEMDIEQLRVKIKRLLQTPPTTIS